MAKVSSEKGKAKTKAKKTETKKKTVVKKEETKTKKVTKKVASEKKTGTKKKTVVKTEPVVKKEVAKAKKTTKKEPIIKKEEVIEKEVVKKEPVVKKETIETSAKYYYMFKMNTVFLNAFSIILIVLCCLFFWLIYGNKSMEILGSSMNAVILLYLPYLVLHEILHSLAYVIYGADFKNITYGAHLEKGVLCCLCKQNINKKNILHSLLYPFIIIGIITLIIGLVINAPILVILSLINISGCSGDLLMFYHLSKLNDFEFSEYNDPIAFGLYTKHDFSKLKMFGLDYVDKKTKLERDDLKKVVISKPSIILLAIFYALIIMMIYI